MVKKRGSNKMTYRPLKNSNMIGAGKKESIPEILKNGSQAKPKDKTFVEHVKPKPKPNKDPKINEKMKELDRLNKKSKKTKEKTKTKNQEKSKPIAKAPVKGR